jgi:hypothetical protein
MSNEGARVLCHHLVGFFGVLGQSNQLRQLTKLPESDSERVEVIQLLKKTAGVVLGIRRVGHPIRGGIDVGLAIDIDEGEIYGPVLDHAYHLEWKVAGGPRVVVGDTCVDYLNFVTSQPATGSTAGSHRKSRSSACRWFAET